MAEAAGKVRMVRCPNCENLLQELPGFSFYRCGVCGAVLTGNRKGTHEGGFIEPSDGLNRTRISGQGRTINASVIDMETAKLIESDRVERIHNERVVNSDVNRRGKQRMGRNEHFNDEHMPIRRDPVHYRNYVNNHDLNVDRPEYANYRPQTDSLRPRPAIDQWGPKNNGSRVSYGPARTQGGYEYENFLHLDEGTSSYDMNPYYEHGGRKRYQSHNFDGNSSIENLENGRAELLRKLDELKDQLSKSCEVTKLPKERVDMDSYGINHAAYVQERLTRSYGHTPYRDRYDRHVPDPKRGYTHELLDYADRPDMFRGPSQEPGSHFMHGPHHEHYPGYYEHAIHEDFTLHRHENHFRQPGYWDLSPKVNPSFLHEQRSRNELLHPDFQYNPSSSLHGPQSYSSGSSKLHQLHSRESIIMNSSYQESEKGGFDYHLPRKLVVANKNKKLLCPIAGGAPFITCSNCFELLKLPRKRIFLANNKQKIKCGACSSTMLFEFGNSGYVVSDPIRVGEASTEIDDGSSGTRNENARYLHGASNSAISNDYEDSKPILTPIEKKPNYGDPEKQMDPVSPTSSLSEKEESPTKLPSQQNDSPSLQLDSVQVKSFPDSDDLPSKEFHDQYSYNIMVSRSENGNKSKRSEQERDFSTSRQSSLKSGAVATEIDVSSNAFSNSCVSQDSVEISKEEIPRVNKAADSFRAGLMENSFKNPSDNEEDGESQVYVNGCLIPDFEVKKAEKLAGPIQPGDYWYDIQAGFWGVMGYPCLGIIMPNIEEFNYPILENCADGNTRVYVNGRELHQKDLDLLASRGLPIISHRSYTVDMSGKVVDDQTGEELDGLGKLAPTVEKAKHGFGMRVPKFITRAQN